jgi:hypothetical protein
MRQPWNPQRSGREAEGPDFIIDVESVCDSIIEGKVDADRTWPPPRGDVEVNGARALMEESESMARSGRTHEAIACGAGPRSLVGLGAALGIVKGPKWPAVIGAALGGERADGAMVRPYMESALGNVFGMDGDEASSVIESAYSSALIAGVSDAILVRFVTLAIPVPLNGWDSQVANRECARILDGVRADHAVAACVNQVLRNASDEGAGQRGGALAAEAVASAIVTIAKSGRTLSEAEAGGIRDTLGSMGVNPALVAMAIAGMGRFADGVDHDVVSGCLRSLGMTDRVLSAIRRTPGNDHYVDLDRVGPNDLGSLVGLTANVRIAGRMLRRVTLNEDVMAEVLPIVASARPRTSDVGPAEAAAWLLNHLAECPGSASGHRIADLSMGREWMVGLKPSGYRIEHGGAVAVFDATVNDGAADGKLRLEVRFSGQGGVTHTGVATLLEGGVPLSGDGFRIGSGLSSAISESMGPVITMAADGAAPTFSFDDFVIAFKDALESGWLDGEGGFVHVRAKKIDPGMTIVTEGGFAPGAREIYGFRSASRDPADGMRGVSLLPDLWVTVGIAEGDDAGSLARKIATSYVETAGDVYAGARTKTEAGGADGRP